MTHVADSTEIVERVLRHPLLARVRPALPPGVAVVGGLVRDAALGVAHGPDIDLVVEGRAGPVAAACGRALGCRVTAHPRFLTATVELGAGAHLDVVTARRERYPRPGALPEVAPGSLADDLARRDFTVNAMAVRLDDGGTLVDPHAGRTDLATAVLRALRPDAFTEDPSRMVRGARYAGRLGLDPEPSTARALRAVAPTLDLSSARVATELARLAGDAGAGAGSELLASWGVRWIVVPPGGADAWNASVAEALGRPHAPAVPEWPLRLAGVLAPGAAAGSALPGWARGLVAEAQDGPRVAEELERLERPSEIDRLLARTPPAAAVAALALGAEAVGRWWREARDLTLEIGGADLIAAGLAAGPAIGRALGRVRGEVLDDGPLSRDEQLARALAAAREDA